MKQSQIGVGQATTSLEPRYNMFQRKGQPDLYCIVPEDRPVPGFITDGYWTFAGTQCSAVPLPGLNRAAAELGVHLSGFHLFQIAIPMRTLRGAARRPGPTARDRVVNYRQHGPKSLVKVTMKRSMRRRIEQQSRLMAAMMVDLQVDAVAVTREVPGAEFAVATFRCLMCDHSTKCGEWLADPNRGSDAPAFCLNTDFFNRHRDRTPTAERW
jgi:hypothetical protein